jgi:hypothetical protein
MQFLQGGAFNPALLYAPVIVVPEAAPKRTVEVIDADEERRRAGVMHYMMTRHGGSTTRLVCAHCHRRMGHLIGLYCEEHAVPAALLQEVDPGRVSVPPAPTPVIVKEESVGHPNRLGPGRWKRIEPRSPPPSPAATSPCGTCQKEGADLIADVCIICLAKLSLTEQQRKLDEWKSPPVKHPWL